MKKLIILIGIVLMGSCSPQGGLQIIDEHKLKKDLICAVCEFHEDLNTEPPLVMEDWMLEIWD